MRADALVLRVSQFDRLETAWIAALTHIRRPWQCITDDRLDPLVTGPKHRLVRRQPRRPLIHTAHLPQPSASTRPAANPSASPSARASSSISAPSRSAAASSSPRSAHGLAQSQATSPCPWAFPAPCVWNAAQAGEDMSAARLWHIRPQPVPAPVGLALSLSVSVGVVRVALDLQVVGYAQELVIGALECDRAGVDPQDVVAAPLVDVALGVGLLSQGAEQRPLGER
jgi:hypothetical protein